MIGEELEFFAVRNQEGQWFHRKGYSGYGETWVEDVLQARIYNKIGPARAQVTFFAKNYPSFGIPDIVAFKVTESYVMDEADRVKKKMEAEERKKKKREVQQAERRAALAKIELEKAQKEYDEAVF